MYKNKHLFQSSGNTLMIDPAGWDQLKVSELQADVVSTDILKPKDSTELNFSGFAKIDFENTEIVNWAGPQGGSSSSGFGEFEGKYLALKPLHMDGQEIVISTASSSHDERSIGYDQTDDTILLDKCRTTRLDTPIITMGYPIAGTNASTTTFIQ